MTDQFSRALDEYGCSVVRECGDDNDDRKRWLDEMNKARAAVEAMYEALRADAERLRWRPMSEAPKDAGVILAYWPNGEVGIVTTGFTRAGHEEMGGMPTHWMSLPEPPK